MRKNVAVFLRRHISVLWNLALAEYGGHGLCAIANNSSINISREICPFNWNCKKNELGSANNYNGSVSVQAPPYYHGSVDMYLSKSKRLW